MKKASNTICLVLLISILNACAFVPKQAKQQINADQCDIRSRSYTLELEVASDDYCKHQSSLEACLFFSGVVVPIGSFIISGSIVLINNTFHWFESKRKC